MKRRLKINGFFAISAVLLTVIFPRILLRSAEVSPLNEIMEIFGITFLLLGQIFRVSARGYKSEHSQDGRTLTQGGPYALVRNPMYLGILLIGFGIVLIMFKWWAISVFLLFFITRYVLLIVKEEKKLLNIFPKDYANYCQQVPRLLPSLSALSKKDISEYMPLKLSWLKREIGSMLAVLLLVLVIAAREDIQRGGPGAYFKEESMLFITIILFIFIIIYLSRRTAKLGEDVSSKGGAGL